MKKTSNQLTTDLFHLTTGLTPSPSPRGEGSNMQCYCNVRDKIMLCAGKSFHSPLPLERGRG